MSKVKKFLEEYNALVEKHGVSIAPRMPRMVGHYDVELVATEHQSAAHVEDLEDALAREKAAHIAHEEKLRQHREAVLACEHNWSVADNLSCMSTGGQAYYYKCADCGHSMYKRPEDTVETALNQSTAYWANL